MGWLRRYERFWREKLDALEAFFNGLRKGADAAKPVAGGVPDRGTGEDKNKS